MLVMWWMHFRAWQIVAWPAGGACAGPDMQANARPTMKKAAHKEHRHESYTAAAVAVAAAAVAVAVAAAAVTGAVSGSVGVGL